MVFWFLIVSLVLRFLKFQTVVCSVDVRVQQLKKPTYVLERYSCANKPIAESDEKNTQVSDVAI